MNRAVISAMALSLLFLVGCSANERGDLVQPDIPEAEDGTDVDACFDGHCEVRIEGSATIPFDEKFDIKTLKVAVEDDSAAVDITFAGGGYAAVTLSGEGVGGGTNNLSIIGVLIIDDIAILRFDAV